MDEVRDWAVPYNDDGAAKHHTNLLMNSDGVDTAPIATSS
ncbi:MAG: hypothetical protein JWO02_1819 [Solirubrobacterales bacterium]|nr:hypothetical protein [Solirubrobacterales bacterium]